MHYAIEQHLPFTISHYFTVGLTTGKHKQHLTFTIYHYFTVGLTTGKHNLAAVIYNSPSGNHFIVCLQFTCDVCSAMYKMNILFSVQVRLGMGYGLQ